MKKSVCMRAAVAELIGTFGFVFIGVGSAYASGGVAFVIALAHGLAIATLATATGPISGGHLNPAVSWALWLGGKISLLQAAANTIAQIAGSIAAVFALQGIYTSGVMYFGKYGLPEPGTDVDTTRLIAVEAILTFLLMFVIWGTAVQKNHAKLGGLMIGLTVTMCAFMGGPLTGASLNPARYLGPAVAMNDYTNLIPYIAAPICGAAIAVLIFSFIIAPEKPESEAEPAT